MTAKDKKRNEENRILLHDLSGPLTILSWSVKKMVKISDESKLQQQRGELLKKAMDSLKKIQEIHASFKVTLSERETEDS